MKNNFTIVNTEKEKCFCINIGNQWIYLESVNISVNNQWICGISVFILYGIIADAFGHTTDINKIYTIQFEMM